MSRPTAIEWGSEVLHVRAPDRVRAFLVELRPVEAANVVRLEDPGVEHAVSHRIGTAARLRPRPVRSAPILQGWNASSQPCSSSTSSGSTQLVASADPEVVRSRLTRFFDQVTHCITTHGGIVQKFAGDAVMAAFGVPFAHEDDPERAVRAALGDRRGRQQARSRGAHRRSSRARSSRTRPRRRSRPVSRSTRQPACSRPRSPERSCSARPSSASPAASVVTTPLGAQEARGFPDGVEAWRVVSVAEDVGRRLVVSVPLVGREEEVELLHNTFARVVRDDRVHLVTVFGAPGSASRASRGSSSTASSARRS